MRTSLVLLFLLLSSLRAITADELTLDNVTTPAPNVADEPLAESFSLAAATRFLDQASLDWTKSRKCFTCHTNYGYLLARPMVSFEHTAHRQVRSALEELVEQRWSNQGPRWDAEVVMSAAVLAMNDAATTGKLHPATQQALTRMWTLQREDGGFSWLKCGWPPMESDDDYGIAIAALAAAAAPESYRTTDAAQQGLRKLREYLKQNPPPTLHHSAMLIWADSYGSELLSAAQRDETLRQLFELQKPDGGWALATLGKWERADGLAQTTEVSDGYGTGFVIYVLRRAGIAADDPRIQRGIQWLKTHQRQSGRWYTRSLNKDSKHFIAHAGTTFAVMALCACEADGVAASAIPEAANDDGFQPLFNGRDLSGWVLVNTPPATWSFEDGMLICTGKPIGELRTDRMYQNFILELEWRHMVPRGNAGVFVWADDLTARGVPFHRGIEVQVLENAYGNSNSHTTHGDIFPIHGATMTPINGRGGNRAFPTEERSRPSPEWNHYRITCQDGAISLEVNGKLVTQGTDCSPRKGYICLESEGGVVHYRNVRIKELPDTPLEAEHIAIANRGYRSLYTGLDLSGWTGTDAALQAWQVRDWVLAGDGQAATGATPLTTTEQFQDFGFVIDVRFKDKETASPLSVYLRSATDTTPSFSTSDSRISGQLEAVGRWNRLEGTVRGNRLSLIVNGREVLSDEELSELPERGPLSISPGGPLELANIFVRELTDSTK